MFEFESIYSYYGFLISVISISLITYYQYHQVCFCYQYYDDAYFCCGHIIITLLLQLILSFSTANDLLSDGTARQPEIRCSQTVNPICLQAHHFGTVAKSSKIHVMLMSCCFAMDLMDPMDQGWSRWSHWGMHARWRALWSSPGRGERWIRLEICFS